GFSFMPHLQDLKRQQLYRIDRDHRFGSIDTLFRASIDTDLVREQWDSLARVAASLRARTAPAHHVLRRLASSPRSDRLAKALTALGRVVKTIFLLRYLRDSELRRRVRIQLNHGESRHALGRQIFWANAGAFRTGDFEQIVNKVTALSVLSNAVLVWNTVKIAEIVEELRSGGQDIRDEDLAHISPLAHEHVTANGTYHFPRARA
ncbi:MAG: Tn3 family transposase, partial [Planctomycetota bacterium]|nr:Tn3 family transposase [Planctomycetota bacterium]